MLEKSAKITSVVAPNGTVIIIPYYEIGNFFENLVNKYISMDAKNKKIFEAFQSEYHYHEPYFDFCILHLGYKIQNPIPIEEGILYGENGEMTYHRINSKLPDSHYYKLSDMSYHIEKVSPYYLTNSIIDPTGIKYDVDYVNHRYHDDIYELILVEKMIYDKELYEDYVHCMTGELKEFTYQSIARYFRGRLGYTQVALIDSEGEKSFFIVIKSDTIIPYPNGDFLSIVKDVYSKVEVCPENYDSFLSEEEVKRAQEMKESIGEKYESRRI